MLYITIMKLFFYIQMNKFKSAFLFGFLCVGGQVAFSSGYNPQTTQHITSFSTMNNPVNLSGMSQVKLPPDGANTETLLKRREQTIWMENLSLNRSLNASIDKMKQMETKNQKLTVENYTLKAQILTLKNELKHAIQKTEDYKLKTANNTLKAENDNLKAVNDDLKAENDNLKAENKWLEANMLEAQDGVDKLICDCDLSAAEQ